MKRMVVISDLHCGHVVGLTPPRWHFQIDGKLYANQKELWGFYAQSIDSLKPIDILVVNGDAIDGKGCRSGGTEQNTTDRLEQCEMAIECIEYTEAKTVRMTYGTPYHAGQDEDFEKIIERYGQPPLPAMVLISDGRSWIWPRPSLPRFAAAKLPPPKRRLLW